MSYFVALTIPRDIRKQLANRATLLADHFQTIALQPVDHYHLTLAFFNDLTDTKRELTKTVLAGLRGYRMRLETADPDLWDHGILIQKLKKAPLLNTLRKNMIIAFDKAGIQYDEKPFYPHITLARNCTSQNFHPRAWLRDQPPIEILITTMTLMQSKQGTYRVIEAYPLLQEPTQYVYFLKCGDGSYYTGWTNHLEARINAHQSGRGAKYTKSHQPVELVYYEEYTDKQTAMRREYACKKMSRAEKEQLIRKGGYKKMK